jgi:hypothetical protein
LQRLIAEPVLIFMTALPAAAACPDRPAKREAITLTREVPFLSRVTTKGGAGLCEAEIPEKEGVVQPT